MDYATLDDLIERAGQDEILMVADRDGDGVADPDVVAKAIADAASAIDGYLAVRYRLPLAVVPSQVNGWAVSIARYHLHRDGAPDHVVRDWKAANADLEKVSSGRIRLPLPGGDDPASSKSGDVGITGPEPAFSKDQLEGWL
ncbi:MAG: DUF1320 domain-containing protein [Martelella sp.]|uniref:gp436 family protein n=1 Tax=Martelella sp. TaxID=1969699 RepID=UPI003241BCEF